MVNTFEDSGIESDGIHSLKFFTNKDIKIKKICINNNDGIYSG